MHFWDSHQISLGQDASLAPLPDFLGTRCIFGDPHQISWGQDASLEVKAQGAERDSVLVGTGAAQDPQQISWGQDTPLITSLSWLQPHGPARTAAVCSSQLAVFYGSFRAPFPQSCHPAFRAVSPRGPACHEAGCATASLTHRNEFWGVV